MISASDILLEKNKVFKVTLTFFLGKNYKYKIASGKIIPYFFKLRKQP